MRNRLTILALVTAFTLTGIIGLQAFWLRNAFLDQETRFRNDIENTLLSAVLKNQLRMQFFSQLSGPRDSATILYATKSSSDKIGSIINGMTSNTATMQGVSLKMEIRDSSLQDSALLEELKKKLRLPSELIQPGKTGHISGTRDSQTLLDDCRKQMEVDLQLRGIHTPFELALIDTSGRISQATCDTAVFRRAPFKSELNEYSFGVTPAGERLQAAFPDANLYLLRRLGWMLLVTIVLVLICTCSFGYLVALFFRQKKYADIRNDFMNNMTHELKTPISSVSVALELVQDKRMPVSEEAREEYLSIARGELKRLSMLVDKVLKMAAFEKNSIPVTKETFAAAPWLQEIIHSFRPVFEQSNVRIRTSVQPESLQLYADRTHLTNVLQNLIENAVKYNDKSEPQIGIALSGKDGKITIQVSDNGKGIPPAYQGRIFDKFFRVPSGDRHDVKGYGLGLSYVKAISVLHEGSVSVNSQPGSGSIFTIELPAKQDN